jgi:hypothetical protein
MTLKKDIHIFFKFSSSKTRFQIQVPISIMLIFFLLMTNLSINNVLAQHYHPNIYEAKGIVIEPNNRWSENFGDNFDYGKIRIEIRIDIHSINNSLYYNITRNVHHTIKEDTFLKFIEFIFIYPNDGSIWVINIINFHNVSMKFDLSMHRIEDINSFSNFISHFIPIIAVILIPIFIVIFIKTRRKT